jgi:hypothetical protein
MELSQDLIHQVFALPAHDRYELAHQLLDSIDDNSATNLDREFLTELRQRREEMLRGEGMVTDWRVALSAIEGELPVENQG